MGCLLLASLFPPIFRVQFSWILLYFFCLGTFNLKFSYSVFSDSVLKSKKKKKIGFTHDLLFFMIVVVTSFTVVLGIIFLLYPSIFTIRVPSHAFKSLHYKSNALCYFFFSLLSKRIFFFSINLPLAYVFSLKFQMLLLYILY